MKNKFLSRRNRWTLFWIDFIVYIISALGFLWIYPSALETNNGSDMLLVGAVCAVCVFGFRYIFKVYRQIWRYSGMAAYVRLIAADLFGGILFILLRYVPFFLKITFPRAAAMLCVNLLGAISLRVAYQYIYQTTRDNWLIKLAKNVGNLLFDIQFDHANIENIQRIRVAIVGAGKIGVMLAEELLRNRHSAYTPVCFVERSVAKIGRDIMGLPVLEENDNVGNVLAGYAIQEVVFALPPMDSDHRRQLYDLYARLGYRVKVYDYPFLRSSESGQKRSLREFDIEELLFRKTRDILDVEAITFYYNKTVLVTGGGGSIGSELCRQIAKMKPKRLIVADVYENGAYDLQQELKLKYASELDFHVEIVTVCDRGELKRVFEKHRPDIVLHAAAHKHVPLMETNPCEAVRNNVFGTLNTLEIAEECGCKRFIMVSTDKAVNPTNIMGATKRVCEMLVLNHNGNMKTSATRFGNVLGSNGSVVPLFKRQILNGGPVTVTDKRIIRYFMTIPEAAQLVLTSGAMAKPGELFVLDMGKPVKIVDLAENMIRLSGFEPYKDIDIVETGLREGEKLYEELLLKSETLTHTKNELIFIEKDDKLSEKDIQDKLKLLNKAVETNDDTTVRRALKIVVPTFKEPSEINQNANEQRRKI